MLGIYAVENESKGFEQQSQFSCRDYYNSIKLHIYPLGQGKEAKEDGETSPSLCHIDNKCLQLHNGEFNSLDFHLL